MLWIWSGLGFWLLGIYPAWRWAIPRIDAWLGNVPMTNRSFTGWRRRHMLDAVCWPMKMLLLAFGCALVLVMVPVILISEGYDRIQPWFMRRWPWTYFYPEAQKGDLAGLQSEDMDQIFR
jgi:hypothetical protein